LTYSEGAIGFSELASDTSACDPDTTAWVEGLIESLSTVASYVIESNRLVLLTDEDTLATLLIATPTDYRVLDGEWELTAVTTGDTSPPLAGTPRPSISVSTTNSTILVRTGCSTLTGELEITGLEISIDGLEEEAASSDCPDDATSRQQRLQLEVLSALDRYELDRDRLKFVGSGDSTLEYRRAK
jgi:heat shock protein HslJ